MRYAIYYTPPSDHALTRAAEAWLGRSAFTGVETQAQRPQRASARRYGFHATLKAPFRLAEGEREADLVAAFDRWAAQRQAFQGPRPVIAELSGFFALVPDARHDDLDALARDLVRDFEPFRAPLGEAEIARRNPERLTERQRELLGRWGYPYVEEEFFFHMTLTDRIDRADQSAMRAELDAHFAGQLDAPLPIATLGLFVEPAPGAPFQILHLARMGGAEQFRKTA